MEPTPSTHLQDEDTNQQALAFLVHQRYLEATLYRSTVPVGTDTLAQTMQWCHSTMRGELDGDEAQVADELSHVGVEFGKAKAQAAHAWLVDLVNSSLERPLIEPTAEPTPPEIIEQKTLARIKEMIYKQGFQGDVSALAKTIKNETKATELTLVKEATSRCESVMRDYLQEMDYGREMVSFLHDFVNMPFAVFKGPVWEYQRVPGWEGNRFTLKRKLKMVGKRVSPWDFFWAPHAKVASKSPYVIERVWMNRPQIMEIPNQIEQNVLQALKELRSGNTDWINQDPDKRNWVPLINDSQVIPILEHHGMVSGRDLMRYGFQGIPDTEFREAVVMVLNHRVIHVRLAEWDTADSRPYQVTCFESNPDTVHGVGVLQRVRKVEKLVRSFMYAAVRNSSASAMPMAEVDYARIHEFLAPEMIGRIMSGAVVPTSPDHTGGGRPAYYFNNVPNNTAAFLNAMEFFMKILDSISGIPAIASGDLSAAGQTLGRSFRGLSLMLASASKGIKLPILNLDRDIQEQFFTKIYRYIQANSPDSGVKADCNIVARGTSAYISREADSAASDETLQQMVQLAQTGMVPQPLLQELLRNSLSNKINDVDRYFPDTAALGLIPGGGTQPGTMPGQATSPGFGGQQVAA